MADERLDPRITPARPDLAAESLRGRVEAARFVAGAERRVAVPVLGLRTTPEAEAPLATELLFGQRFTVYDEGDGWCWGQARLDGYVGYVEAAGLGTAAAEPTHVVAVPRTLVHPEPELKRPPVGALPMTARVRVEEESGDYARVEGGGWVFARHLAVVGETDPDHVTTALRFVGVPYKWGGKTSLGIDCSGLVQVALERAGLAVPRDSDMQAEAIGTRLGGGADLARLERGDLVFFPGHVGLMVDRDRILHANAHHMMVEVEPVAELLARLRAASGLDVTVLRRPV